MTNDELAVVLIRAMERRNCVIRRGAGETNIIYSEGTNLDGTLNDDKQNQFNDLSAIVMFRNGVPYIAGKWEATTAAGKVYTVQPLNPEGAAHIDLGQQRCWKIGWHRGVQLGLVQTGGDVIVLRDKNKDYKREGDKRFKGAFGINHHAGYDFPRDDIRTASAGCLVRRRVVDHNEFMELLKADPAYVANKGYIFYSTVIEGNELGAGAAMPTKVPASEVKMVLKLTPEALRKMFPSAPKPIIDAFVADQAPLAHAGILDTPQRLAYCFANLAHETGDWTIKNLTENINYSAERAALVWPSRFSSGADVHNRFGNAPGWQLKMFDDVYGNRMGNRAGTSDGSRFIGRGGPQVTGRDGYREVGKRAGLDLENHPELASMAIHQPAITAAFWSWKRMNELVDAGDFVGLVKRWNGGTIGFVDRQAKLSRILPIAKNLARGPISPEIGTTGVIVAAGGAAVATAANQGWSFGAIAAIVVGFVAAAVIAYLMVRWYRAGVETGDKPE